MYDRPKAKTDGVVVEWADDELIIFDRETQIAHCLAAEAALVWERCDGRRSHAEIARELTLDPLMVERALEELRECGLLDEERGTGRYSRREAVSRLAKIGGAAITVPLIYSAAVPPAYAAGSCVADDTQFGTMGTCTATAGHQGTASASARCCSGTGAGTSCYRGESNNRFYCTSAGTCAPFGQSCHNGNGGLPCCAGGGQTGTTGTAGVCVNAVCTQ